MLSEALRSASAPCLQPRTDQSHAGLGAGQSQEAAWRPTVEMFVMICMRHTSKYSENRIHGHVP